MMKRVVNGHWFALGSVTLFGIILMLSPFTQAVVLEPIECHSLFFSYKAPDTANKYQTISDVPDSLYDKVEDLFTTFKTVDGKPEAVKPNPEIVHRFSDLAHRHKVDPNTLLTVHNNISKILSEHYPSLASLDTSLTILENSVRLKINPRPLLEQTIQVMKSLEVSDAIAKYRLDDVIDIISYVKKNNLDLSNTLDELNNIRFSIAIEEVHTLNESAYNSKTEVIYFYPSPRQLLDIYYLGHLNVIKVSNLQRLYMEYEIQKLKAHDHPPSPFFTKPIEKILDQSMSKDSFYRDFIFYLASFRKIN